MAGAGHRVPLVADAAGVEDQRIASARACRGAAKRRRDEARLAVGVIETAVGEKARLRALRRCRPWPLERLERRVVRGRDVAEGADVEIAPSVVFASGEAGVFGENLRGPLIGEGLCVAHRRATSQICRQSGIASPGVCKKRRWRETRRSELVTVPSFSPQAALGSSTSASAVVSVERQTSETTTNGQLRIASRTRSASGMLSAGLVPMIHSALIRPSSTARNMSTALRPGFAGDRGRAPEGLDDAAVIRIFDLHMRGQHVGEAADFAPAHRVRLAGDGERPHAGLADPARSRGGN